MEERSSTRICGPADVETILGIINDSAKAYKNHIPEDCYHEPYMSRGELEAEIADGVAFYGIESGNRLVAVMGIQDRDRVVLIRHAYTRSFFRSQGLGSMLISKLKSTSEKPMLVGTWAGAVWAIRFYQKHGFRLVSEEEKNELLEKYWRIPERQVETSVVLADSRYPLRSR